MKKIIMILLVLALLATCAAAGAENGNPSETFASLTGLDEVREKLAAGKKFSVAYCSDGRSSGLAENFEVDEQADILLLWEAVEALELGEKTEEELTETYPWIHFWLNDNTCFKLQFTGRLLYIAGGECYRLENDSRLWQVMNSLADQYHLALRIDGRPYILGKSTPQDLINYGWDDYTVEQDGTIGFHVDYNDAWIYMYTEHGTLDEPILAVNAFWSESETEYCGFDGAFNDGQLDDPDTVWYEEMTVDEIMEHYFDDDFKIYGNWEGLRNWLTTMYGAVETDEGICQAMIPLHDGRTVYVSTHDSPVRISLLGFE